MITVKINVVATIIAGLIAGLFYVILRDKFTNVELATIAILVTIVIRVYDAIASLPAFSGKKSGGKGDGKK